MQGEVHVEFIGSGDQVKLFTQELGLRLDLFSGFNCIGGGGEEASLFKKSLVEVLEVIGLVESLVGRSSKRKKASDSLENFG